MSNVQTTDGKMDSKAFHLGLVQGIINRMAGNSFLLKGWSVTLTAAILTLTPDALNKHYSVVIYLPIILFWLLDAYYFYNEKLFRNLYDLIVEDASGIIIFSLKPDLAKSKTGCLGKHFFSWSVLMFHGLIALLVLVSILIRTP